MSAMRLRFTWSDAWVLAAIAIAGDTEGATLKEIIAAGDSINGTLFSAKELRRGLAKLTRVAYVRADGELFAIAGAAREAAAKILKRNCTSFCVMLSFEGFLDAEPYSLDDQNEKDKDWSFQGLTDELVATACASYQEETAGFCAVAA
jgi:hypothetical protein